MKKKIGIVWFKRDLRLSDHKPLKEAIESGLPLIMLFIFEPEIESYSDFDYRHWVFAYQGLNDINQQLVSTSQVQLLYGSAIDVFEKISNHFTISSIWSYQETGNDATFSRDKLMSKWFASNRIQWKEYQSNGILRAKSNRQGWTKAWFAFQSAELDTPDLNELRSSELPHVIKDEFSIDPLIGKLVENEYFQRGGTSVAHEYLESFLQERSNNYNRHISKPQESRISCSRLSPYIAWGNLSIRQIWQATQEAKKTAKSKRPLSSFSSRLQWHCHFIQKFESEPETEFQNVNRGFDQIRTETNHKHLEAWKYGNTGIPLVDACMRCVHKTGYLNFRMRAMVVSFLTHHLWQPWQEGAQWLAKQFLDYEPGIHYSQFQMQAGTVGINTIRIYNPIKQSQEQDTNGDFIKQWVPELVNIPSSIIHEPWKMTTFEQQMYQCVLGVDYPHPIVPDLKKTYKDASATLWSMKADPIVKEENRRILARHVRRGMG